MKKALLIIRRAIAIVFVFCFYHSFAQNDFLWPLPQDVGKVEFKMGDIINPITGLTVFNNGYFILAPYKTPVYAVADGVLSGVNSYLISSPDLIYVFGFPNLNSFKNMLGSDFVKDKPWFCESNLMGTISIKLKDGSSVNYSGLVCGDTILKRGMKVKRGDIIGYVGYFRVIVNEPCIQINLSTPAGKVGDIGIPLLGENNHLEKIIKTVKKSKDIIDTATLHSAFKLFRESLEEGHPSLYRITTKEEFSKIFKETESKLNKPMSRQRFCSILMPVVAKIGCSHTIILNMDTPDQPEAKYAF
jgi:hypothetical protein